MEQAINYKLWTVCMVQDEDRVLLIDRQHGSFQGYIPPGGKVHFPESILECAIREVREETGLVVRNLVYKGIYEYVNPVTRDRYMIFNYITRDFKGSLIENGPEGKPLWFTIDEAMKLPMQASIRRRFPLFFQEGTFEIHVEWDHDQNREGAVSIRHT